MTATPTISVIIPSYNHASVIRETLDSVFKQTLTDWELIVIDDGSTDESVRVIKEHFAEYPRLRTSLVAQKNQGAHAALNRAIESSTGRYISILNSDDIYESSRLAVMLDSAQKAVGPYFFGFSLASLIDDQSKVLPVRNAWSEYYKKSLTILNSSPSVGFAFLQCNPAISTSNFFFSRELFDAIGGFSPDLLCHDLRFATRAIRFTEPVVVHQPLFRYRVSNMNSSGRLAHRLAVELPSILSEYVANSRKRGMNALAPSAHNWPIYFEDFIQKTHPLGLQQSISSCALSGGYPVC